MQDIKCLILQDFYSSLHMLFGKQQKDQKSSLLWQYFVLQFLTFPGFSITVIRITQNRIVRHLSIIPISEKMIYKQAVKSISFKKLLILKKHLLLPQTISGDPICIISNTIRL